MRSRAKRDGRAAGARGPARATAAQRVQDDAARRFPTLDSVERVLIACDLCPRLREHCLAIARERKRAFRDQEYWGKPVPSFGDSNARILIIGLAPAAHGGNRTGRVFTGDSSGSWLYSALHKVGYASQPDSTGRDDGQKLTNVYVTAAAHCAPPQNKPTPAELANCRPYLEAEIRLLTSVRVVLGLGRIGHEAYLRASGWWSKLTPRERPPFAHGAEATLPDGTILLSSFHPSRQNTNTGKLTREMWDEIFRRAKGLAKK